MSTMSAPVRPYSRFVCRRPRGSALLLALIGALVPLGALAQPISETTGRTETTMGVAVYRFAEPGQAVIPVDLWGSARRSGRYFIPPGTTLLDLISLSGGPLAEVENDAVIRETTVAVSRLTNGTRTVAYSAPADALAAGGADTLTLQAGDVVTITTKVTERFTWLDGVAVAAAVASLALLVLRIAEISGGI